MLELNTVDKDMYCLYYKCPSNVYRLYFKDSIIHVDSDVAICETYSICEDFRNIHEQKAMSEGSLSVNIPNRYTCGPSHLASPKMLQAILQCNN